MNFSELIKTAGDLQARAERAKKRLSEMEVTGEAGGGLVKVRMDGSGKVKRVKIDPSLTSDLAMMEDLVVTAIFNAQGKAEQVSQDAMREALGGLSLPPGVKFPF